MQPGDLKLNTFLFLGVAYTTVTIQARKMTFKVHEIMNI